jgi:hypothetical protein
MSAEETRADWFTASNGVQVRRGDDGEIVTRTPTERGGQYGYHGNRGDAIAEWQASREVTEAEREAMEREVHRQLSRLALRDVEDWAEDDTAIGGHAARIVDAALVAAREVRS